MSGTNSHAFDWLMGSPEDSNLSTSKATSIQHKTGSEALASRTSVTLASIPPYNAAHHGLKSLRSDNGSRRRTSPSNLRKPRSKTFDLGSCVASVQAELCASCQTEICTANDGQVVYGLDNKFCSEGCRCVLLHGLGLMGAEGMESLHLIGKRSGVDNPCMHHDQYCPHFASRSAGLIKNKFIHQPLSPYINRMMPGDAEGFTELAPLDLLNPMLPLKKKCASFDNLLRALPSSSSRSMGM